MHRGGIFAFVLGHLIHTLRLGRISLRSCVLPVLWHQGSVLSTSVGSISTLVGLFVPFWDDALDSD